MSFNGVSMSLAGEPMEDESPEDLFVRLYRCAMAGLCYGDTRSWDFGQRLLAKSAPPEDVGPLFGQFYAFGRALIAAAQRPLTCRPITYAGPCAEEALALRMIEMIQRGSPVGAFAAAAALVGVEDLGGVLQSAQALARGLALCGLFVRAPAER